MNIQVGTLKKKWLKRGREVNRQREVYGLDDGVDDDDVVNRDGEHTLRRTRLETISRMLNAVSLRCQ